MAVVKPVRRTSVRLSQERRVADIMSAARRVIAERGYENALMSEIAEQAGIVEGSLYRYFENKRDLLTKVAGKYQPFDELPVAQFMTPNPETLPPSASVAYALNKMSVDGYRHIPIVDEHARAIGVLSVKDIVNFVVEFFPESILNLPLDPDKAIFKSEGGG